MTLGKKNSSKIRLFMKLAILMSIYYKEKPIYFHRAMQSIWDDQTLKPNEIVLDQDGKLTNDSYNHY